MAEKDPFLVAEKIFLYHAGELSQAERQALERQLLADPRLKSIANALGDPDLIQRELQQVGSFDAAKAYRKGLASVYPPKQITRRWAYRWVAASIAFIILLAGLFYMLAPFSRPQPAVLITQQDTTEGIHIILATGERVRTDTLSYINTDETSFSEQNGVLRIQTLEVASAPATHKIVVPHKKTYQVALPDGSRVFLNAGSTLTFPATFGADERRVQLEGEAYFEITPMSDVQFIVDAGSQQIRVYGTAFNVKAYQTEPVQYTTLIEGRISLQNAGAEEELFLTPGNRIQFDRDTRKTLVQPVNLGIAGSWKDGWLAFDNLPMDEILRQIGRWYNLEVVVLDPSIGMLLASGKIPLYPDVDDVLRKFEKLGDVRFEASESRIIADYAKKILSK